VTPGALMPAVDADALARDAAAFLQVPSVTGREREALAWLAALAGALGLPADLHEHDLGALRRRPDHPGEEAPRQELLGLTVGLAGGRPGRVCLNGHVDVVGPGTAPWRHGPWSGAIEDGWLYGRGAVDMKGAVVAALHALAALRDATAEVPTVVLQCVASEEDGGQGTFAALEHDAAFDACLIPEPTSFEVVCAQAGALTFHGVVHGRAAHAAQRLAGRSAIDRYVPIHLALEAHERAMNAHVGHPLMRALELPYPLSIGRVHAGTWSSSVPDRLEFTGRVGVPVGESIDAVRTAFERVVHETGGADVEIGWTRGAMAPGETDPSDPWVALVREAVAAERGTPPPVTGVPWGADMRLFAARGIPVTMVGPPAIERAHATDERVRVDDLATLARVLVRVIVSFGRRAP
jgi:acetylornithine deacetylase